MSATSTTPPSNFQQLPLIRKALAKKKAGALSYVSQSGHHGCIAIVMGDIIGGEKAAKELSLLLSEPVTTCGWTARTIEDTQDWIDATLALSRAINHIQWTNEAVIALKQLFFKLPPVRIRMIPLHRYEYTDGLTYLMLYQQSVKEDGFLLSQFLNDAKDGEMLRRRVKVLVLGYCLGLITAIPKQTNTSNDKKSTAGIASRILRRIRGM